MLVYGPPCGGKSTLVQRSAGPGDVVLDLDVIAQQLGSPRRWMHQHDVLRQADAEVRRRIALARQHEGTTWVIRSVPRRADRADVIAQAGVTEVIACVPPLEEALRRCWRDRRPRGTASADQVVVRRVGGRRGRSRSFSGAGC